MRKQFEMSQDEYHELRAIAQEVLDKNAGVTNEMYRQKAFEVFKRMGKKYGFKWDTAEPPTGDNLKQFMAESIET